MTKQNKDEEEISEINIVDILGKENMTETTQGYKMTCPDCGLQGGRTEGFIIFPDKNQAFCHSSGKWFKMLEAYALKKKIIRCLDGRESGDTSSKILRGELYTLTLDEFRNEFGTETYNQLQEELNIRQRIELPGNNRYASDFANELGDIYKSRNVLFFRGESREIVEIGRFKNIDEEGKEYSEIGFIEVDPNRFVTLAEMFIKPWSTVFTKNGQMNVDKSMTTSMASISLKSPNMQNKLPIIKRIFDIQIPIMKKGTLAFPRKGYDKRFGSWLPFNAPQIKEDMFTLEEAKALINKIFEEFCFATEKDRTHAIAAFITPFLRGMFPRFSTRTPVFIYMANRERAGKDYCAGCTGMLYEGVNTEEPAISNDEKGSGNANEEIRKKIMACFIQGKKRFHSSNNKGLLNNSIFEGIITAPTWSDRILGKSKNVKFDNEMDYSLSGNIGIRLTPDLANRARIINLHLVDEDANAREFKNPNLHEWILDNRGSIISALYVLVKNWVDKGMPKGSIPFTSFPHWAKICGGVMEAAGYNNPCESDKTAIISLDSETEEMKLLFETCFDKCPNKWLSKDEIKRIVEENDIMPYLDFNVHSDKIKFGIKIDKFVQRILSGIYMNVDSLTMRNDRRKYKFSQEFGGVGGLGSVCTPVFTSLYSIIETKVRTPPTPPTPPTYNLNSETLNDISGDNFQSQDTTNPTKVTSIDDLTQRYKDSLKTVVPKEDVVVKSDRELQFYESPECADIVIRCSKDQVLEWIKNNPKISFEEMDKVLGLGCLKHVGDLINEGLVQAAETGWICSTGNEGVQNV